MRPDVELKLPVDSAYVAVLRATTVSLAARLDFTIDEIEDLRIAVGEASAMVMPNADTDTDLVCQYFAQPAELTIRVAVDSRDPEPLDQGGFAWQMLAALTTEAVAEAIDGQFSVTMTMRSTVAA